MNQDQVRIEVWQAAYNVIAFGRKRNNCRNWAWILRVLLILGTLVGFAPMVDGFPENRDVVAVSFSALCSIFGIVGMPLIGFERSLELFNEWRRKWIEIRDDYLSVYREAETSGKVPAAEIAAVKKRDQEVEKDDRCAMPMHFSKNKVMTELKQWFSLHV